MLELLTEASGCSVHGLLDIKFLWDEPMVSDVLVIEGYPFGFNLRGDARIDKQGRKEGTLNQSKELMGTMWTFALANGSFFQHFSESGVCTEFCTFQTFL